MRCIRMKIVLWSYFKFNIENARNFSGLKPKIMNSYNFTPGNIALSASRMGDIIDEGADKCGDNIAIISAFQNISKTYSEFRQEVERLASGLISIGLKKGDRIGLCAPNCYEWPLTQFAAAKAGLILVSINAAVQSMELEYCLKKVDCKVLITWDNLLKQNYYKILCDIIPELPKSPPGKLQSRKLPHLENIIMISNEDKDGTLRFKDVINKGNKDSDKMLFEIEKSVQFDDPVNIQFTSGTTGEPKAAVLTHHNLVNISLNVGRRFNYDTDRPAACCQLPLFHCFGCVQGSLAPICFQGKVVFPSPTFHAVSSLKAIENHKCSILFGTPTMFVDIIRHYQTGKFNIGTLKLARVGGAATSVALYKDINEVLGITTISLGYGLTETSGSVAYSRISEHFKESFEFMVPMESIEVKIIDKKGEVVSVNTQGEICIRGYNIFIEYWGNETKTAEILDKAHWFHTGDLGVMNEEGFIKIVGRIKDMIIRGGENIYPSEVENFLSSHPSVLEVHICGVPDVRLGEEACAWICLKEGKNLTEEEIKEFCKGKISHYKIPRYIMFVKEFPKTGAGKAKKFEMAKISIEKLKL